MSGSYSSVWAEDDIQFDSRFLELKGDTKIDLKRFSSQGYVEPGKYNLQVQLNKQPLAEEYDIYWYAGEDDASKSYACLTPELVAQFGLKEDVAGNDSNLLIVFYVQIMPDDLVMQLHRF
ncbi:hypothetical protein BGK49_23405 [Shigella sp. FC1544]|nr:fimbriae usher protein StfC [Shigella dysenteriae 225-75]ODQ10809.1 hypothetical protein BGK49_23405 [Shigella sp. FC1544]ODQ13730.1 hypothetical protein BGK52_23480 [Shigella sp. FC1056]OEG41553.1 hypothetical protein BHQ36_24050 [Shigella sp. FC2531]OEG42216.1 hypothetical protein BHQ37_23580 [Shigella sp. FC2541]OEG51230.1 hypothetical protein BHQ39_24090 [Shigella sp. FC3196]OEI97798.1 hypothetical protein BHE87_23865 [Shigella sp. FC1708]OEJ00589.1 hypothetical protein BHE88_24520 [S